MLLGLFLTLNFLPEADSKSTILISLVGLTTFHFVGEFLGLFRHWRGVAFEKEAICTLASWSLSFLLIGALGQFTEYTSEISGVSLLVWASFSAVFSLVFRVVSRWIRRWRTDRGINTRRYAVVGVNKLGIQLARNIDATPDLGLRLLGFYDDRPDERTEPLPSDLARKLGVVPELIESAQRGEVDVIFITLPMRAEDRIRDLIGQLSDSTASVYIVPDLFVFQMLHSRWSDVQGIPIVSVFENPLYGADGVLKRSLDIVLATLGLILLAVPLAMIAMAIKATSRGPVLFKQLRYGLDGKPIRVWKFRSMTVMENGATVQQARQNDNRLTPIGGFLRRSSLDELPQLFNVLMGSMSLVGPRPHANAHNEFYRKQIQGYMLRHKVKPGMTGLAQVNGCRGETETLDKMESRIQFDHQYIREWTIWMDFKIILQTFAVVFSRQNAY
jgi:putative colanic acid biosynthesis UDP-glucose lipid carrier transferase